MSKKFKLNIALILLISFCTAAFIAGALLNSGAAFTLSGVSLSLFVALYAVGVLGYKVGGGGISFEVDHRLHDLEQSREELKTVATAIIKALHVVAAKSGGLSGMSNSHVQLIDSYLAQASNFLAPGAKEAVEKEMRAAVNSPAP